MKEWKDWNSNRRLISLQTMNDYVNKHCKKYGIQHWNNTIEEISGKETLDDAYNVIIENDELYIEALFIFYVAVTTDLSWIIGITGIIKQK